MSDIRIQRAHALGLPRAREIAQQWARQATDQFGMACSWKEGAGSSGEDQLAFQRQGVKGSLLVAADRFELTAQLGFLLSAFQPRIQGEIEKNLDELLAAQPPASA